MTELNDGQKVRQHFVLGVEGGATKTEWIYLKCGGKTNDWEVLQQGRLPAANFKLISRRDLLHLFSLLPQNADRVGIYLPGVLDQEDNRILHDLANRVWPEASISTGSDRDSGLAAAFGQDAGILVISGTGSSMTGRRGGHIQKAGGKGHLVGDKGSAYHVAMEALRLVMDRYDETEKPCQLAEAILRELRLNEVDDIIDWVQGADKPTIARLATIVFQVYRDGDLELLDLLECGVEALAHATAIVAKRLSMSRPLVALQGSMFTKQELYVKLYTEALHRKLPQAKVSICQNSGSVGAARLAIGQTARVNFRPKVATTKAPGHRNDRIPQKLFEIGNNLIDQQNNRPLDIDKMTAKELVDIFIEEEKKVYEGLLECQTSLGQAIEVVAQALVNGGLLIYVGAGQRWGAPDATEIARIFGEPPTTVRALIAGGGSTLRRGSRGEDDDPVKGAMAITQRGVTKNDVVCGIIESSGSPFVLGALNEANRIGATTLLLTNSSNRKNKGNFGFELELPNSGSTTMALEIITTGALVLLRKVKSNLAVSLRDSDVGIQDRVTKMVARLTGHPYEETQTELQERYDWDVLSLNHNMATSNSNKAP